MLFRPEKAGENRCFAKDPCVVRFHGTAYLYYSKPVDVSFDWGSFHIGIARSNDLEHWECCGEIAPTQEAEGKGICAPGAIVLDGVIHLFYQSYGQFPKDYICHATSTDGIHFVHDESNPIIIPEGDWNIHRAIDADVVAFKDQLLLYWATRDPAGQKQLLGVSGAPLHSQFARSDWRQLCDAPILAPERPWEQDCIEAPAAIALGDRVYLFYGGAYNCCPQQIGCAVSHDGVHFQRLHDAPLLANGAPGTWNACESGHPYIWQDEDGTIWLFYQGSPDHGQNWMISKARIVFPEGGLPCITPDEVIWP